MFDGQSMLVTGGTDFFAKPYARSLIEVCKPRKRIIFSHDELKQFEIQHEFNQACMRCFIGNVEEFK